MISLIITAASSALALGAVAYALFKVSKSSSRAEKALVNQNQAMIENTILILSNEDLARVNGQLSDKVQTLTKTLEMMRKEYEEAIKKLLPNADANTLVGVINDRLQSLQELSEGDDH